jgi:predicted porin
MKKLFVLSAIAIACTGASAQSSVQLYGVVDAGINHITGLQGGSQTHLASGIMDGSRWGLKGNEDLGNGFKAIFTMEARVEADTGNNNNRPPSGLQVPDRLVNPALLGYPAPFANSPVIAATVRAIAEQVALARLGVNIERALFDRQAYVGLVTPVGAFIAGRQYTPAFEVLATYDTMNTQSSLSAAQVAAIPEGLDRRMSNALQYRIELGGLKASLMAAPGENSVLIPGSTNAGRFYGLMGRYDFGRFSVGAGYNTKNNEFGQRSLTSALVGASAKLGNGTFSGFIGKIKDDNPTGTIAISNAALSFPGLPTYRAAFFEALKQDAQIWHVGYRYVFGPHTLATAYTHLNDKRAANADVSSYGAAYSYAFSKRTDLNFVASHFDNKNLAQAAPGGAGFIGGVTASAGKDSNNFALGIRHRF